MLELIENPPDVGRVLEGLSDSGYNLNTAIADIVDNSIAAGASRVDVRFALDYDGEVLISIGDDGCGMDRAGLINATKYGSKRRDDPSSLGKFGLGLKTASTAFCRQLIVISRSSPEAAPLKAISDTRVMSDKGWVTQLGLADDNERALLNEVAPDKSGTVVIWSEIYRGVPNYKDKGGAHARKGVKRLADLLSSHLSMVFQRFLDETDGRARNVEIHLNHQRLVPWDPFCVSETKGPALEKLQKIETAKGDPLGELLVRAFILPRKEEFSSIEARNSARVSVEMQGIYVYRENRLIHGPDWLGLTKPDSHLSLLRVELSFTHHLDEQFNIDLKKSQILLPDDLYQWLDKTLAGPRREADDRSRKGNALAAKGTAALLHKPSNSAIEARADSLAKPKVTSVDTASGTVDIDAKSGHQRATLLIGIPESPNAVYVTTAATLDDGVLWSPALLNKNIGVTLNTAHAYYQKAYLPNRTNSPLIQALDFLLYALGQAELNNADAISSEAFVEFRIDVSRNLRKLVQDLPDPDPIEE